MVRFIAAATLLMLACQPAAPPPAALTPADREAIDAQHAAWASAANAGNWAAVAALYTEDATALPPNAPVVTGRPGIQQAFAAFPPIGDARLTTVDVDGTDDMAVVRGTYSMTMMPPGATAAVADTGKFVEVWRKQADGTWLISWDIWNSDIPLPAPEPAGKK